MINAEERICFVIAPIGDEGSPTRTRSDRVLRHIVRPAALRFNYRPVRADEIAEPGIITSQVIQRVVDSPLVIADLSEHNPNVFYELALRHAVRKPYVQIIQNGETIPFDVATARTVFFGLDIDGAADAAEEVAKHIEALESDPTNLQSPVSITMDLQRISQSTRPEQTDLSDLFPVLADINSTVRSLSADIGRLRDNGTTSNPSSLATMGTRVHRIAVNSENPYGFLMSIGALRNNVPWLHELGTSAYRHAVEGEFNMGRDLVEAMIQTLNAVELLAPEAVSRLDTEWRMLFDRLVAHIKDQMEDIPELPF